MKSRKVSKSIIAILIGTMIIFVGLMIVSSGEKIQAFSIKEFIADYGGYGIKGEWETLGTAGANLIFKNEEGSGWIMLGENKYLVAVSKQYVIEREGEQSVIYEGNLIENEGIVRFALYKDVMVGEIEVEGLIYSFGVAQMLDSARYVLDQYNEHLQEEIEPPPFEDLIIPDDRLIIPATIDIDPDTLNLKSKGEWITVYIELPAHPELPEFDVTQIDLNTVRLNNQILAENNPEYTFVVDPDSYLVDHNNDGLLERMVKFNIARVQEILEPGDRVKIELTGSLIDGRPFYDLDWIKVIGEKPEKLSTTLEGYPDGLKKETKSRSPYVENLSPAGSLIELVPGRIEGAGTYFEIKDSEYLNITLKSTEEIKIVLESIPRMISLDIEASVNSTELTFEGLEPNKTYYKYQNSYKNEAVFISDEKGSYDWTQDLTQSHHIWFQEVKGTVFLPEDCQKYGIWDESTKTCTLIQDLTESVEIRENNITLDCNGHNITGSNAGYGIYLNSKENIVIKNCRVTQFSRGIFLWESFNDTFVGNMSENNYYGIFLYTLKNVPANHVISDNILTSNRYGIYVEHAGENTISDNAIDLNDTGIYLSGSSDNNIANNYINSNDTGIYLFWGSRNNILFNNKVSSNSGSGIFLWSAGYSTLKNNIITGNKYNFGVYGFYLSDYLQDIDTSNTVDGKPILYLINEQNKIIDSAVNIGYIGVVNSNDITIRDSTFKNNSQGILFAYTTNSRIEGNTLDSNAEGIWLWGANNNTISNNNISLNGFGIHPVDSVNNTITNNKVNSNNYGIYLSRGGSNLISNNTVNSNRYGILSDYSNGNIISNNNVSLSEHYGLYLLHSNNHEIYHNNFIDNYFKPQVWVAGANNIFDNGYPSGGNYWSDYTGIDEKSGENQDQPGSDGIGDTPYIFSGGQDRYPFMRESGWEPVVPRERIVSVYAVADEEYIGYYDNWWNPWDEDQWISEMIKAVELGDNAFEEEFQINFVVKDIDFWDSDDSLNDLDDLFDEAMREVNKGTNDIMVAFTNQDIKGNLRESLFWGPYTSGILGLAEGENLGTEEAILGDDIIVVLVKNQFIDNVPQHEYSHLFGAADHCWYLPSGEMQCDPASDPSIPCIMRYDWVMRTNSWCSDCYSTISSNKWREF